MARIETIGNATLYLGDCREILPTLGKVDAVVTDPPYGQKIAAKSKNGGDGVGTPAGNSRSPYDGSAGVMAVTAHQVSTWDDAPPDAALWQLVASSSDQIIAFGFNRLAHLFGSTPKVLIWDKKGKNDWNDTFADAEIAWTQNVPGPTRVFRHLWVGGLRASEHQKGAKVHPAQKPIEVMAWCLRQIKAITILDPWMGSGSTGVAAAREGRKFIGIEIEPRYFDIACRRIEAESKTPALALSD